MRGLFLTVLFFSLGLSCASQDFNALITQTSDTLAKKILSTGKKKVAITYFLNLDQSITQLGVFLSEELSSELANRTENQTKFRVLERSNLDQIFKEKHLVGFADPTGLAKELGKLDAADALIFATITNFDGFYRVVIKMLDTRNGDALSSYKVSFVKTPSLENLNNIVVKNSMQLPVTTAAVKNNNLTSNTYDGKGDFCFKNIYSGFGYNAKISISKTNETNSLKTIHVRYDETGCMYDLPSGIYTVSIIWLYGDIESKKETKEIRVVAGKSGMLEMKWQ